MNNPSENVPIHRQDVDATNGTRPLRWSVWRELWENRSIYIAPLSVAVVVLFGFMISTYGMPERRRGVLLMDLAKQRALISEPYDVAAMMLIFTVFIVGVFYCLDALYGERRDRSILVLEIVAGFRSHHRAFEGEHSARGPAAGYFRDNRCHTICHAAVEQRGPADERSGRNNLDTVQPARAIADITLQLDRAGSLARAHLRMASPGFRLGAAGDFSVGGNTAARDHYFRNDYL